MTEPTEVVNQRLCDIKTAACQKMMFHKFDALEKIMITRFDTIDEALVLRTSELERRLHGLNELRNDVINDREMLVRKDTYEFGHRALEAQVNSINEKINLATNRLTAVETRAVTWTAAVALFFIFMQVILHFWGPK